MTQEENFQELTKLLDSLSITLKYGRGFFRGGLYRYKDETVIYLNRLDDLEEHINIIVKEISQLDLSRVQINPVVKQLLFNSFNKQEVKDVG